MRWVKPDGPHIYRDKLHREGAAPIVIGSAAWQAWLTAAETREFVFRNAAGDWHRARREWRRGQPYWYVACRVGGRVRRFYLGAAAGVDGERLAHVAAAIAAARAAAAASGPPAGAVAAQEEPTREPPGAAGAARHESSGASL
jgi:hypothetical protein